MILNIDEISFFGEFFWWFWVWSNGLLPFFYHTYGTRWYNSQVDFKFPPLCPKVPPSVPAGHLLHYLRIFVSQCGDRKIRTASKSVIRLLFLQQLATDALLIGWLRDISEYTARQKIVSGTHILFWVSMRNSIIARNVRDFNKWWHDCISQKVKGEIIAVPPR